MKVFISYSHHDEEYLRRLEVHLSQLQRDGTIQSWTDKNINAGKHLDSTISKGLETSGIFIALLSPDYIASGYCYDKEFNVALQMEKDGKLSIVPIIAEPCDWLNTPFKEFKALPKDGKSISEWVNANNAFLDIAQNLRKLLSNNLEVNFVSSIDKKNDALKNYRIKKDFDSIQKIEFIEDGFKEIKELLKRYLDEISQLENIKSMIRKNDENEFEAILVNRNMINKESHLLFNKNSNQRFSSSFYSNKGDLNFILSKDRNKQDIGISLEADEYHLFWKLKNYMNYNDKEELSNKEIVDFIWGKWLDDVGIN